MKLLSIIAISAACLMSTAALADPISLSDKQMDGITAGAKPEGYVGGETGTGVFWANVKGGTTALGDCDDTGCTGHGINNIIAHVPLHTPVKAPEPAFIASGKVTAQELNSPSNLAGPPTTVPPGPPAR